MEPNDTTKAGEAVAVVRVRAKGRSMIIPITRQANELGIEVGDDVEVRIRRVGP